MNLPKQNEDPLAIVSGWSQFWKYVPNAVALIAAAWLALEGNGAWGWFLFVAVIV